MIKSFIILKKSCSKIQIKEVLIIVFIMFGILFSNRLNGQELLRGTDKSLMISYKGEVDSIFFVEKSGTNFKLIRNFDNKNWTYEFPVVEVNHMLIQYKMKWYKDGAKSESNYKLWKGKNYPNLIKKNHELRGTLETIKIWSKYLEEERELSIYKPINYSKTKKYPVIYFADGSSVQEYANYVEYLINQKKIPEIILVGIHSGKTPEKDKMDISKNKRSIEYLNRLNEFLPAVDSTLFDNHLRFFCEEAIKYVENNYSIDENNRTLYGFSNGASFTVTVGLNYPSLFKYIISCSIGWDYSLEEPDWSSNYPKYYLIAGSLEKDFNSITRKWYEILKKQNRQVNFKEVISFHDNIMWREEFLKTLLTLF